MNIGFQDWRFFILVNMIFSALWSVLVKYASLRLNAWTTAFLSVSTAAIAVAACSFDSLRFNSLRGIGAAVLGGALGGIGTMAFYKALGQAPASVVVPLTSLYLCLSVILAGVLLGESISMRQILGIACAVVAWVLLAR